MVAPRVVPSARRPPQDHGPAPAWPSQMDTPRESVLGPKGSYRSRVGLPSIAVATDDDADAVLQAPPFT